MARLLLKPKIEPLVIEQRTLADITRIATEGGTATTLGTTYGFVEAEVNFEHNPRQWTRLPGKPVWKYTGSDVFVRLVTRMFLPLEYASNLLITNIVKGHEMRHVKDAISIVNGDLLKELNTMWKFQTLFQEEEVSELNYQTFIVQEQFDEMVKEAFAKRWERKVKELDTKTTYSRMTWEIQAVMRK
jgi:hypothetical protein